MSSTTLFEAGIVMLSVVGATVLIGVVTIIANELNPAVPNFALDAASSTSFLNVF